MWKVAIYVTIGYLILLLITKIFDKRKVKKYGRDITINGNITGDNSANDSGNDNGTGDVGTDKQ